MDIKISTNAKASKNDNTLTKFITLRAEKTPSPPTNKAIKTDLRNAFLSVFSSIDFLEILNDTRLRININPNKAAVPKIKKLIFVMDEEFWGLVLKIITSSTPNKIRKIEIVIKNFSLIFPKNVF